MAYFHLALGDSMTRTVVSIGYQGRSLEQWLELLLKHNVRKVLDVRELPLSRKKGFSKNGLSSVLAAEGIEYLHLKSAGNPHRLAKSDVQRCLRLYRSHLARRPQILAEVQRELTGTVAVLCFERVHAECHRSVLLELLKQKGVCFKLLKVE